MHDDQKPQGTPDLYCAKYEDDHGASKCRCLTEQGTRAEVPHGLRRGWRLQPVSSSPK